MFKRISEAEHEAAMKGLQAAHAAYLEKLAGAANLSTENLSQEQIAEAVLSAVTDQEKELSTLSAKLETVTKMAESSKIALDKALEKTAAHAEKLDNVKALFGDDAKAEDFDLVKAVGDIVPEPPTATDPKQTTSAKVDAEIKTELDEINAQYAAGDIGLREFMNRVEGVKPGRV